MSYSDAKYGLTRRITKYPHDDLGATGASEALFSFSEKTDIVKFGIIPVASDCISSTTTTLVIETDAGTDLGTWTPGDITIGTGSATGKTITATSVAAGKVLRGNVTEAGSSGSFLWFVDVREQFDQADSA